MDEQVGAQVAEQRLEHSDTDQAEHEHVEGGQALVDQDLVDDDLEEQGGDEAEDLEDEGGGEHLAEQRLEAGGGRQEPGEAEAAALAGRSGLAR